MDKKVQHILNLFADCVAEIKEMLQKHHARLDKLESFDLVQDEIIADLREQINELKRQIDDGK